MLLNEVVSNVDVLCAWMELCRCGECNGSGVVKENFNRDLKWKWEFGEEGFKPEALLNDVDDHHVFRLGGGQGYRRVFFRHMRDQSARIKPGIARYGATSSLVRPACICVHVKLGGFCFSIIVEMVVERSCQVTKHSLPSRKVARRGIGIELRKWVDYVRDVGSCVDREVYEFPNLYGHFAYKNLNQFFIFPISLWHKIDPICGIHLSLQSWKSVVRMSR